LFALVALAVGTSRAQTPADLLAALPPIAGWTVSEQGEVFGPDNLYNRINGAAPLFLENNFREMTSLEYRRGEEEYITIQVYRHATPQDAFGMYASERSSELEFFPIGGEAQGDDTNLFLFAGNVYVKMWANAQGDVAETLRAIGKGLADKVDPEADYPALLRTFPTENRVPYTETYTTSNYIGHNFLNRVYSAQYQIDGGKPFQLFVIDGEDQAGAQETLQKYMAFTRQTQEPAEGLLTITDRYNGDIPLLWQGRYLIGLFSPDGETVPNAAAHHPETAARLAE
jgi:hypothetical protein